MATPDNNAVVSGAGSLVTAPDYKPDAAFNPINQEPVTPVVGEVEPPASLADRIAEAKSKGTPALPPVHAPVVNQTPDTEAITDDERDPSEYSLAEIQQVCYLLGYGSSEGEAMISAVQARASTPYPSTTEVQGVTYAVLFIDRESFKVTGHNATLFFDSKFAHFAVPVKLAARCVNEDIGPAGFAPVTEQHTGFGVNRLTGAM